MANNHIKTKIVMRRDTPTNWSTINPALLKGEFGVEVSDSGVARVKIGVDGVKTWNDLPYFGEIAKTEVDGQVIIYNDEEKLTLVGYEEAGAGARLQRTADGIEWFTPVITEAELKTNLEALAAIIGEESTEEGVASTGLIGRIEALETQDGVLAGEIDALEQTVADGFANVYTKEETNSAIATAVADASHLKRIIVDVLPTENIDENTIYMVLRSPAGETQDVYNEYIYINGAWELIGNTTVDLSEYAKTEDILVKSTSTDFIVTEAGELTFNAEAAPTFKGNNITEIVLGNVVGLQDALDSKVAKEEGKSLVEDTLITKLNGLADIQSTSEEFTLTEGVLAVNEIAAAKVTGLPAALEELANLKTAQTDYVKSVAVNGTVVEKDENQQVNISIAIGNNDSAGLVKGSSGDNKVAIAEDGTMSVDAVNVNSFTQTTGEWLILDGGGADINAWE